MSKLSKSGLITDPVLREHYDWLLHLCDSLRRTKDRDSYYFTVANMVRNEAQNYTFLAAQETPPAHVLLDDRVCPWSKLRQKAKLAAEAFSEMQQYLEGA